MDGTENARHLETMIHVAIRRGEKKHCIRTVVGSILSGTMGKSTPAITPLTNEFSTRHEFSCQMSRIRAVSSARLIFLVVEKHASEKRSNVTCVSHYCNKRTG